MIRREIQLAGLDRQWLLISQVEHARISAVLAQRCLGQFGRSTDTDTHVLRAVRKELISAIVHHDDGWEPWEVQPQLDAEHGRPLSFRELPLEVSLPIWSASVEAAAEVGPLAAWMVSGHFLALLLASDKPPGPQAAQWQRRIVAERMIWLANWQAINLENHTRRLADEALLWLQLFDVTSLWLCSACPGHGEQIIQTPENYRFGAGKQLETQLDFEQDRVRFRPWRLDVPEIQIDVAGSLVPIREYGSAAELDAARIAHSLHWQLTGE